MAQLLQLEKMQLIIFSQLEIADLANTNGICVKRVRYFPMLLFGITALNRCSDKVSALSIASNAQAFNP